MCAGGLREEVIRLLGKVIIIRIKITYLDKLFREFVKLRAKNICERCGRSDIKRETSHFYGRRMKSVRWNEDNAAWLCFVCHRYFDEHHYEHSEWFKKRLGEERFEKLTMQANTLYRVDEELVELYLRQKLKELDDQR